MDKSCSEFIRGVEKVRCQLCGGKMPAHDFDIQIEHMLGYHSAESGEEAVRMAKTHFVKIEGLKR
jgi:hypothetical protein